MPRATDFRTPPSVAQFPGATGPVTPVTAPTPLTPVSTPTPVAAPAQPAQPVAVPKAPAASAVPTGTTIAPPKPVATPAPVGTGAQSQTGQQAAAAVAAGAHGGDKQVMELTPAEIANTPRQAGEISAGEEERNRADFRAEDPNIKRPSDFVGFNRFAGLNDDMLRGIADRAANESAAARTDAAKFLDAARKEANASTPIEKTPSYQKYLEAMMNAQKPARGFNDATGNSFEDALRGVYANSQMQRDQRLEANAVNRAGIDATNFNASAEALRAQAAEAKRKNDEAADAQARIDQAAKDAKKERQRIQTLMESGSYQDAMRVYQTAIKGDESQAFKDWAWRQALEANGINNVDADAIRKYLKDQAAGVNPGVWGGQ